MPQTLAQEPIVLRALLGEPRFLAQMILEDQAVDDGHFELLSGAHSNRFFRFSRIANEPEHLEAVVSCLLPTVAAWSPTVVVSPATAGVALGARLSRRLGVPLALAALDDAGRASTIPQVEMMNGARALLVNDVVTTGEGITALAKAATSAGASIAGACWFVTRAPVDVGAMIDAPVAALAHLNLPSWLTSNCPLCLQDEPLTRAGEVN